MASNTPALDRLLAAAIRRQRLADATWGLARIALPAGLLLAAIGVLEDSVGARRDEMSLPIPDHRPAGSAKLQIAQRPARR
ncbi:MAG: hypothetical protein IAG13_11005, partial [Deltaproteobacteria bacterium]|nr:hypothetical protein [Nannocystaceae bacterium]